MGVIMTEEMCGDEGGAEAVPVQWGAPWDGVHCWDWGAPCCWGHCATYATLCGFVFAVGLGAL